jgi:hypothetical protein
VQCSIEFHQLAGNAVQCIKRAALPALGSYAQVGTKEQKLRSAVEITIYIKLATRAAYMTDQWIVISNSIAPPPWCPRSKRRIVEQIELLQNYIDKLA